MGSRLSFLRAVKPIRLSLRLRLPLTYILVISLASLGATLFVTPFLREHFLQERQVGMLTQGSIIANAVHEELLGDGQGLPYLTRSFAQRLNSRVLVLGPAGNVLADAYGELEGKVLTHPEIAIALQGQSISVEQKTSGGESALYVLVPVSRVERIDSGQREVIGIVFISNSLNDLYETLSVLQRRLTIGALGTAIIAALMGMYFASHITGPLVELTNGARQMSRGDIAIKVQEAGDRELHELAVAFNLMSSKLAALEVARRRFVSDASHELRAPLASMKALIEPLLTDDTVERETVQDFLADIDREIDRLARLVADLLDLARLDSRPHLDVTLFDLRDTLLRVANSLQPLAKAKGVELELLCEQKLEIKGDEGKLYRAVLNIMDNAIKFAVSSVQVSCQGGGQVHLYIRDDGPGIPLEAQDRIFERFYRVDQARARVTGGSGLGLSIAYEIVTMHNGRLAVDSQPGYGTEFVITLPRQIT